jgi:hypothetical protein
LENQYFLDGGRKKHFQTSQKKNEKKETKNQENAE